MKKKKGALLLVLLLAAGAVLVLSAPKQRAMGYFYRHSAELEADVAHWQAGEPIRFDPRLTVNVWEGEHKIVEYIVAGRGLAPSGTYYGFFYSPDGVPVSFQNSGEELSQQRQDEWVWQGEGDNRGYVELMRPCWYYFEASL